MTYNGVSKAVDCGKVTIFPDDGTSTLVILADLPSSPQRGDVCVSEHLRDVQRCCRKRTAVSYEAWWGAERAVASKHNRVVAVDVKSLLCGEALCVPILGNVLTWLDWHHTTGLICQMITVQAHFQISLHRIFVHLLSPN